MSLSKLTLAALATALATPPSTAQRPGITRPELIATDPAIMHRRLRDFVWELIEPKDFRDEASGKGQLNRAQSLTSLTFQTRTMPGATRGLCRRQYLRVGIGPRPGTGEPANYRAESLQVDTKFHFFQPPQGAYNASSHQGIANPECERLPSDARFFHAANELAAHDGLLHFLQAQVAVRAGKLKVECDQIIRDIYKTDCRDDVLRIESRDIDEITGCSELPSDDCFSIIDLVNSRRIEVKMGGSPWRPERVLVTFFALVASAGG